VLILKVNASCVDFFARASREWAYSRDWRDSLANLFVDRACEFFVFFRHKPLLWLRHDASLRVHFIFAIRVRAG
jgi:hypothetical protein